MSAVCLFDNSAIQSNTVLTAAKSAVGIGIPKYLMVRKRLRLFERFFCAQSKLVRACFMVGCMGALSSAPLHLEGGNANPVQSTTHRLASLVGGQYHYSRRPVVPISLSSAPELREALLLHLDVHATAYDQLAALFAAISSTKSDIQRESLCQVGLQVAEYYGESIAHYQQRLEVTV